MVLQWPCRYSCCKNSIAFKEIEIRPQTGGDVTSAKATFISPYGLIVSDWKKTTTSFELTATIPANTSAIIYLPAKQTSTVTEGGKDIKVNNAVKWIGYENANILLRVGSGSYTFKVD